MNKRLFKVSFLSLLLVLLGSHYLITRPVATSQAVYAAGISSRFTDEPTDRSPEIYRGSFFYSTAPHMLTALGVRVAPEDKVYAFPDPSLRLGSELWVFRAQAVAIQDGANLKMIRTWSRTVGDLLKEQRISLGDQDIISPAADQAIPLSAQPFSISITRVALTNIEETEPIDYQVTYQDDPNLEKGKQQVKQAGQEGALQKTFAERRENGQLVSRQQVGSKVLQTPVTEVIARGTKIISYGTVVSSWYGGVGALTAAHPSLPFGTQVRVVNVATGASVVVTIADRGPFVPGRGLDLSADAFARIAPLGKGTVLVRMEKAN